LELLPIRVRVRVRGRVRILVEGFKVRRYEAQVEHRLSTG